MNKILWKPKPEDIIQSNMLKLGRKAKIWSNIQTINYKELHKWSVQNPKEFWSLLWEDADIIGESGSIIYQHNDNIRMSEFFPDGRLNYSENLLSGDENREAIVFYGEGRQKCSLTLAELRANVASLSSWFLKKGVKEGDRVAALLPNCPETVIAMLATSSIGAIFTSCSPDFGEEGIIDRFGQCEPSILITCDGYGYGGKTFDIRKKVLEISKKLHSLKKTILVNHASIGDVENFENWEELIAENMSEEIHFVRLPFMTPLYILYSSGTTGKPKCIVHSAGGVLLQHIKEHKYHCNIKRDDRVLYFTTCGWMMWNWVVSILACEATLVLYDGSPIHPDPYVLFDIAQKEELTFFGASAKYIDSLNKMKIIPSEKYRLENLKVFASTGSPLAPESYDWVYGSVKKELQLSSISGGTDLVACFVHGNPCLPVRKGEIQCASLGMNVQAWDDNGERLIDKPGELVCTNSFPSMPIGFWGEKNDQKYKSSYFERYDNVWHHGDYIIETGSGSFIVEGRSDATLNPGGIRIGTAEIYRQVESLPDILEALAVGQNWQNDQRIILFVITRGGRDLDEILINSIKEIIRKGASPRHVPAKIFKVEDFPRTRSGKITEIAVRDVIHGKEVKNTEALKNPDILESFKNFTDLYND